MVRLVATFRDFLDECPAEDHRDPGTQWALYDQGVWADLQTIGEDPHRPFTLSELTDTVAEDLLTSLIGDEWVRTHRPVALREGATRNETISHVSSRHRFREMARRLYEFQSHPWFERFAEHVRRNDLSATLFEADVIQALMYLWPLVERHQETGVKGADFDVAVRLAQGAVLPVEAKTKEEGAGFTAKGVTKTVRKAAGQLPAGSMGWVFLRIPFAWVGPALEDGYRDAVAEAVRNTSRVAAVFTAIDKVRVDAARGGITRVWECQPTPGQDSWLAEAARRQIALLESSLDHFAPRAPF